MIELVQNCIFLVRTNWNILNNAFLLWGLCQHVLHYNSASRNWKN